MVLPRPHISGGGPGCSPLRPLVCAVRLEAILESAGGTLSKRVVFACGCIVRCNAAQATLDLKSALWGLNPPWCF